MYSTNNTGSSISPIIGNGILATGSFGDINLLDLRDDTLENGTKIKIKCTTGFSQGGSRKFQLTVNPPGGGISETVNVVNDDSSIGPNIAALLFSCTETHVPSCSI